MQEMLGFLERKDLIKGVDSWSDEPLDLPFELKPEDFIKFAEDDLKEDTEKALVNSLSNIKRSIDCRIESLLYLFGLYEKAKKEGWTFPDKIDFLLKTGIVAPRILTKINRKRNELEHEFKKPIRDQVEDFLDVANLFLLYTEIFVKNTYEYAFELILRDRKLGDDWIDIKLSGKKGLIEVNLNKKTGSRKIEVTIDDRENYIKFLKHWAECILNK